MPKKTPPFPAYKEWTTARFFGFLRSGLRRMYSRWPPKYKAMAKAKRDYKGEGRQKYEYKCNKCNKYHPQKNVEVDHLTPCGSLSSYEDLPGFVERLFVSEDKLQILCKPCHKEITAAQRAASVQQRQKMKK